MGVIQKQSLLFSITSYIGLFVSVIASLLVYPLEWATYGTIQFVISVSQLLLPVLTLGFVSTVVRFFPEYNESGKAGELLVTVALTITTICATFLVLYPHVSPLFLGLLRILGFDVEKFVSLQGSIFGIAVAGAFSFLLTTYITNYKKIFVPTILVELSVKLIIPLLILLKVFGGWSMNQVVQVFLAYHVCVTLVLVIYLRFLNREKIQRPTSFTWLRIGRMTEYSLYNMFNVLAYTLVYRLDIIMITLLLGETYTGYYSLLLFVANVIEIPGRGVIKITGPMVAKLIETQNFEKIKELYQKASVNLMLVCGTVAVIIYAGLEPLLFLIKDGNILVGYIGVWVMLVLGKWINQTTSLNSHIINYSENFRWSFYFLGVQAIINIVMNYYLIQKYGLYGAAIATTVSIVLNNILKMGLVKIKYGMWPFKKVSFSILIFLLMFITCLWLTPLSGQPIIDVVLRSLLCGSLMIFMAYKFSFSEQLNLKLEQSALYLNNKVLKFKT